MKPEEVDKILEVFRDFTKALGEVFESLRELLKPLTEITRYKPRDPKQFDRVMSITPNKIPMEDKRNRMYFRRRLG